MIFITGGNSQGKLAFARRAFSLTDGDIADGAECAFSSAFDRKALDRLHLLAERMIREGIDPETAVREGIAKNPGIIVLCDELGCGIVPASPEARLLRERVGRLSCVLASEADRVYRIVCGLPQLLKGDRK
jgi:adenosyl cobinamide kinase/adenosyl cobinamide phosphate guanylyltransferase